MNTQIWTMYDPFQACFVTADGYMIMWGFLDLNDLSTASKPLVCETQGGASFFYFVNGKKPKDDAINFVGEIDSLMPEFCGGNRRSAGEKARSVKVVDAIEAMC